MLQMSRVLWSAADWSWHWKWFLMIFPLLSFAYSWPGERTRAITSIKIRLVFTSSQSASQLDQIWLAGTATHNMIERKKYFFFLIFHSYFRFDKITFMRLKMRAEILYDISVCLFYWSVSHRFCRKMLSLPSVGILCGA